MAPYLRFIAYLGVIASVVKTGDAFFIQYSYKNVGVGSVNVDISSKVASKISLLYPKRNHL